MMNMLFNISSTLLGLFILVEIIIIVFNARKEKSVALPKVFKKKKKKKDE